MPWFCLIFIVSFIYSFLYFVKRIKGLALVTYLSYGIIISGAINFLQVKGLHIVYIPYVFFLSLLVRPGIVIPLSIVIPFLELKHFLKGGLAEEVLLSLTTILIGSVLSIFVTKLRKQRDGLSKTLERIREEADFSYGHSPVGEESLLSQHLYTKQETDEEIKNLLGILRRILQAEAVGFFLSKHGSSNLRCSVPEEGLKGLNIDDLKESDDKGDAPVILRSASVIVSPVREAHSRIGSIVAIRGEGRFNSTDIETMELFSEQVSMIIRRERINKVIKRDQLGLRLLIEGSSRLNSSLEMKTLSSKMAEAMYKVAPLKILFFIPEDVSGKPVRFRLFHYLGIVEPEDRIFDLKNTLVGNYRESQEPVYLSDLRGNRVPILPLNLGTVGSLLILPLLYEKEHIGMLLFISERIDAISSYQINLLKILGNQASTAFANARLYARIERMAITDGLTGLYNHRHFQERLSLEFNRLSRLSTSLSLLLIDIDHFKKINDTYGHPAGDEVLRGVAGVIRDTIRNIDIPARYGGEEFAVLLPDTKIDGAIKMAERLRSSILNRRFSFNEKEITVTVSTGIATSPYDAKTKEELIERADEALYRAKQSGRNRCVSWGQP
ncbi:MAG: diguanylate cyclase [Thermodesulfovibrionales bacterium]